MDELKKLMAEAQTDEPWSVVWYGDEHLPAIAIHRTAEDRICFMPTIQHPADGVQFEANALLIVAAVNALPELLVIKAERDRAQRACEQMGERIAELAKERERRVEWQPIETAPRDGQDILVYCQDSSEMFVGFSNPDEIAADPGIFFYALRTDGRRIGCRPHLWRPLPTPPATTQHEDTP